MYTTHGKHEAAAHRYHGRIADITTNHVVMKSDVDGEYTFSLAHDVQVSHAGKPCRIEDLKVGDVVRITVRKDDDRMALMIASIVGE